jgi:hypothetical protein
MKDSKGYSGFGDGEWENYRSDSKLKAMFWYVPIKLVQPKYGGKWAIVELGLFGENVEFPSLSGRKFVRIRWRVHEYPPPKDTPWYVFPEDAEAVFVQE